MLMIQMNTLEYKLLPLSLLDSRVNRLIRNIDTGLVNRTAEALRAENEAILTLKEVAADEVFQKHFSSIRKQISKFQNAFWRLTLTSHRTAVERTERRITEARNMLQFFGKKKLVLTTKPISDGNRP